MRNYYTDVDCFLELIHLLDQYLKDTILIWVFQENIATLKGLNNCSNQVRTHRQQVSFGIGIGNDCQWARDWWEKRSYIRFDIIDLDSMRLLAGRSSTHPSKFQYFICLTFEDAIIWKIILGILRQSKNDCNELSRISIVSTTWNWSLKAQALFFDSIY